MASTILTAMNLMNGKVEIKEIYEIAEDKSDKILEELAEIKKIVSLIHANQNAMILGHVGAAEIALHDAFSPELNFTEKMQHVERARVSLEYAYATMQNMPKEQATKDDSFSWLKQQGRAATMVALCRMIQGKSLLAYEWMQKSVISYDAALPFVQQAVDEENGKRSKKVGVVIDKHVGGIIASIITLNPLPFLAMEAWIVHDIYQDSVNVEEGSRKYSCLYTQAVMERNAIQGWIDDHH